LIQSGRPQATAPVIRAQFIDTRFAAQRGDFGLFPRIELREAGTIWPALPASRANHGT
jgi:hypothetical protein